MKISALIYEISFCNIGGCLGGTDRCSLADVAAGSPSTTEQIDNDWDPSQNLVSVETWTENEVSKSPRRWYMVWQCSGSWENGVSYGVCLWMGKKGEYQMVRGKPKIIKNNTYLTGDGTTIHWGPHSIGSTGVRAIRMRARTTCTLWFEFTGRT